MHLSSCNDVLNHCLCSGFLLQFIRFLRNDGLAAYMKIDKARQSLVYAFRTSLKLCILKQLNFYHYINLLQSRLEFGNGGFNPNTREWQVLAIAIIVVLLEIYANGK